MDDGDGLLLSVAVFCLALAVLALAHRVASLEENADLAVIPAEPGTLLDNKQAIERRAVSRAEARGRRP